MHTLFPYLWQLNLSWCLWLSLIFPPSLWLCLTFEFFYYCFAQIEFLREQINEILIQGPPPERFYNKLPYDIRKFFVIVNPDIVFRNSLLAFITLIALSHLIIKLEICESFFYGFHTFALFFLNSFFQEILSLWRNLRVLRFNSLVTDSLRLRENKRGSGSLVLRVLLSSSLISHWLHQQVNLFKVQSCCEQIQLILFKIKRPILITFVSPFYHSFAAPFFLDKGFKYYYNSLIMRSSAPLILFDIRTLWISGRIWVTRV
jgi:hypothetical protein